MEKVVIFGASGHGSVVLDCIEKQGEYQVIGFIDSYKSKGEKFNGYEILGSEYDLPQLIDKYNIYGGIIAIGDNWTRKLAADRVASIAPNLVFISAIHPNATIGRNCYIGEGAVVMPGAIINANSWIGDFCIINTNASLDHNGKLGNFSSIAPRVSTGGNFNLGKYSAVSLGASVIENISIGEHTVVGAGSVVINDIADNLVVYGTPAKVVRNRAINEKYLARKKTTLISVSNSLV